MTVITTAIVMNQPAGLRAVVGERLASTRWQSTCNYYNKMSERERLTICFHAQLRQRHSVMKLEEMNDCDRERIVCAIDELRSAFAKYRSFRITKSCFIGRLSINERRTLYFHAGLSEEEFSQPYWRIEDENCTWREALFRALRELFSLFENAPTVLTSVRPETYFH